MATASSTYTWTAELSPGVTYGDNLRTYVGLEGDTSKDSLLQEWLAVAAQDCDDTVKHSWVDDEGNDVAHSPKIWLGIKEWVKAYYGHHLSPKAPGRTSVRTGPFAETYAAGPASDSGLFIANAVAKPYWHPSIKNLLLAGRG